MSYNNGGDDGTMIMMIMMICFLCCCCAACGCSLLTAWANDGCDTTGTFSFLKGEWYTQLMGGNKLFQCGPAAGGGSETSGGGGSGGANVSLPEGKKCNVGNVANYDYTTRVWNASSNAWECPSGYTTTWCGVATDANGQWVDGENNERQCRIRKGTSGGSGSDGSVVSGNPNLKVTLVDDANRDDGGSTFQLGVGEYRTLSKIGDKSKRIRRPRQMMERSCDNKLAAIDIPEGLKVILYQDANFGGDSVEVVGRSDKVVRGKWSHWIDGHWADGSNRWDSVSSMQIMTTGSSSGSTGSSSGGCNYKSSSEKVWVFEKENYAGNCQSFGSGTHNLNPPFLNNTVGSIKFPKKPKRKVKLCTDWSLGGKCKYFKKDTSRMHSSHKGARSIQVYK